MLNFSFMPRRSISVLYLSIIDLGSLNSGMPNRSTPPMSDLLSNTVTS